MFFLSVTRPRSPISILFPYTTLFRSVAGHSGGVHGGAGRQDRVRQDDDRPAHRPVLRVGPWACHRSEEHTSELQSRGHLVCRLLLEKKNEEQQMIDENENETVEKSEL